jgi:hypothetical protein
MKPLFRIPPDGCNLAYRNLFSATSGRAKAAREQCEELWRHFHDLADKNFADRFPFEFNQRWFEMYLGTALRDANLDVSAPKPGPDFCVTVDGRQIYIEAVTPEAGHPQNPDRVPEPIYKDAYGEPIASRVPHAQITLRLAGAFHAKAGVYNGYRFKKYIPQDATCLIAINLRDIPHAWADAQEFWMRALYGIGDRFVSFDLDGGAAVEGRHNRELLQGTQGYSIEVASLLSDLHADIGGVIGSSADAGNIREPLGDDFVLMPHAKARSPYPVGFIGRGIELKLREGAEAAVWHVERVDYGGLEPQGPNAMTVNYNGEAREVIWQVTGRELSVRAAGFTSTQVINRAIDPVALAASVAVDILRFYDAEVRDRRRR